MTIELKQEILDLIESPELYAYLMKYTERLKLRDWRYQKLGRENDFSIPFEYKTTVWPDIEMFDVEEKDFRFKAEGYGIYEIML